MRINLIAAFWGLAEATVFFIVPDVWLSIVGRNNLRVGLIACLYSLVGALIGGLIMFYWGTHDQNNANQWLAAIPAISMEMIDRVNNELSQQGLIALLLGPVRGTPYKVYASQAAGAGMSLWLFILTSIPARLIRFVLVTVFFHYALKVVNRKIAKQYNIQILVTGWTGFYLYYFFVMGVT